MAWVIAPASVSHAAAPNGREPSSANAVGAPPPDFETGAAPAWVIDVDVPDDAGVSSELLHDGVADLLADLQVRLGDGPEHAFRRNVAEVIEPGGVSSVGRIQIEFAATYQTLVLHWIRLVRDGEVQDRLDPTKVRLIQQEEDLELDLFYQSATALVILDDVRVGDRVDYAYSIVGANPIFEGRYQDRMYLEWWYPFGRIHNRIVAPRERQLHVKAHNTDTLPEMRAVAEAPDLVEYVWQGDAVPAAIGEDETPADHDPLASHQVSEFETWDEVARWARGVFDLGETSGEGVEALAARIRAEHATPEARTIAALRFVQDEVRYLGLEIGVNAYRPHSPNLTLERRFGDCKDKSSLVVALLDELGVEAHVALVNTELGPAITRLQPTAHAFDHAIVVARVDGRDYWLDPTATYERGPLEDEEWFDYGFALVVGVGAGVGVDGLTVVEPDTADLVPAKIEHMYTTTSYDEPTNLDVTSTLRGDRADGFRSWSADTAIDSIERQYQNYYARDLPRVGLASPLTIVDDEVTNTIVVTEHYRVPGFWEWDEEEGRHEAVFVARDLRDELSTPDTVQRDHPLATSHPDHTELTIRIHTPEPMSVRAFDDSIEGPAFTLDYGARTQGHVVLLEYDYHSTADRVAPDDVPAHLDALDDAWGATDYGLRSSDAQGKGAGELWRSRRRVDPEVRRIAALTFGAAVVFFYGLPWALLQWALRRLESGDLRGATVGLRIAARASMPRSTLGRRVHLALSVALGLWGREDEALGHAARSTRMHARAPRNLTVLAVALAWRAALLSAREPERAERFADRGVDVARELPGAHGLMAATCALSMRSRLRANRGAIDAAARDLGEARAHRSDEGDRERGWAGLMRIISDTERAELATTLSTRASDEGLTAARQHAERSEQAWPAGHPILLDAMLVYAEQLRSAGRNTDAWRELDRVETGLGVKLDAESPLRARAAALHEALSSLD